MDERLIFVRADLTPIRKLLMMHVAAGGKLTEYTVTGNPVSFTTDVQKALTECLVSFSPVQSGSGDPSPENIRPITGITGANVYLSDTGTDDPDKQTFAVTFPEEAGTVYGGTLDLATGELMISHVEKVVRGTDAFYASNGYIKSDAFDAFIYLSNPYGGIGICNILTRSDAGIWGGRWLSEHVQNQFKSIAY